MLIDDILAHANEDYPNEACGLVVAQGKRHRVIRARNLAHEPGLTFDLDPGAWLEVRPGETVVGIYHSHPSGDPEPSLCDLSGCEASGLPWHIVGCQTGAYRMVEPRGFRAPYVGRPYVYGAHDCWTLARDWYQWEWGLKLPDFRREPRFWLKGQSMFVDNLGVCGFVNLVDEEPLPGDAFLVQVASPVPNHVAVWLGDGTILHHVQGRLSTRDPWGGYWQKHASHHIRHNSKMGTKKNG